MTLPDKLVKDNFNYLIKKENNYHARLIKDKEIELAKIHDRTTTGLKDKEIELAKIQNKSKDREIDAMRIQLEIKKLDNESLDLQLELAAANSSKNKPSSPPKKNNIVKL